ncbi:MAG: gas vesicle protein GvpO [Nitrospinota bacterium]
MSIAENGMPIEQARNAVSSFLKNVLKKEGKVIKVEKTDKGWEVEAEIIEVNEFIKSLGISKTVYDQNFYVMKLDGQLEVTSYDRLKERPAKAEESLVG